MTLCAWCIANQCDRRTTNHAPTCPCADPVHKGQGMLFGESA